MRDLIISRERERERIVIRNICRYMKIMDTLKRVKVGSEKEEDGILHAREIVNYYLRYDYKVSRFCDIAIFYYHFL